MNNEVQKLQSEINELQKSADLLAEKKKRLASLRRQCQHHWGEVQPKSKYHPGYTTPGDPPGTMGVDWRGPVDVPSRTEEWWERTCKKCGKVEKTTNTVPTGRRPVF